jgi:hypothetical protein
MSNRKNQCVCVCVCILSTAVLCKDAELVWYKSKPDLLEHLELGVQDCRVQNHACLWLCWADKKFQLMNADTWCMVGRGRGQPICGESLAVKST